MIDVSEYEDLAGETGVYKDIELDILKEGLSSWRQKPGNPFSVVEIRDGKILAGFALLCRETSTDYTFEVRAMCVDPSYIGKGVADSLLDRAEDEARRIEPSAILRIETSTKKAASLGAGFFELKPYSLIGHIPDFYSPGDDYYMFARHLRQTVEAVKEGPSAATTVSAPSTEGKT